MEVVIACGVAHGGLGDHVLGIRTVRADGSDSGRIDTVASSFEDS